LEWEINNYEGINYAKVIVQTNRLCKIIFISQKTEYAYLAYEVHPFSFIQKPINRYHFKKVFEEACEYLMQNKDIFSFSSQKTHYQLLLKNILYFQSDMRTITVFCITGETYSFYDKMKNVEKYVSTLAIKFIRIHQSYFVNQRHIKTYHYEKVEMHNGTILSISESKRKQVRSIYHSKT